MKRYILTLVALCTFSLAFAQKVNELFGIPVQKDFKAGAKVMMNKGFEVLNTTSDSITLKGTIEPFGTCVVQLSNMGVVIGCHYNQKLVDTFRAKFGVSNRREGGADIYEISEYSRAAVQRHNDLMTIAAFDYTERFAVKFMGMPLGTPLKVLLPELSKHFKQNVTHGETDGNTYLSGVFAGYRDCSITLDADEEDKLVTKVGVFLPKTAEWSTLYAQYCHLKGMLKEKYGEPIECEEDLIGPNKDNIVNLNIEEVYCMAVFAASEYGEITLAMLPYGEFDGRANICLIYEDFMAMEKQVDAYIKELSPE